MVSRPTVAPIVTGFGPLSTFSRQDGGMSLSYWLRSGTSGQSRVHAHEAAGQSLTGRYEVYAVNSVGISTNASARPHRRRPGRESLNRPLGGNDWHQAQDTSGACLYWSWPGDDGGASICQPHSWSSGPTTVARIWDTWQLQRKDGSGPWMDAAARTPRRTPGPIRNWTNRPRRSEQMVVDLLPCACDQHSMLIRSMTDMTTAQVAFCQS